MVNRETRVPFDTRHPDTAVVLTQGPHSGCDFTTVTEVPGAKASGEQLAMLYTRYCYAAEFCEDKDVFEVACGAGPGLGYLARKARRVVGGDFTAPLLHVARRHYRERLPFVRLDAHTLPFSDASFDVIICYEAIYYLAEPEAFFKECCRVLRSGGILVLCSVNKEWADFNPSPFSQRYFSAKELNHLLIAHDLQVECFAAFPVPNGSASASLVSLLKRAAVRLHLVPKTMKGKEWLKRIIFGELAPLPAEVEDGLADYLRPQRIMYDTPVTGFKVLYTVARLG